jgi:hypothetical protein
VASHPAAEPELVTPFRIARSATGLLRRLSVERVCDVAAALMILAALVQGLRATSGLRWPYDPDHFRDIAFAQTALDGHPLSDASYPEEWIWYNPLVPWLVAIVAALARVPPTIAHVAAGPYLNLLGPVFFYVVVIRLAGRPAALVSLALMLFFICREDCWACATYSPWLFTSTFSQGLFYASVLALLHAGSRQAPGSAVVAGALLGVTFLSHTAPALILALIAFATLPSRVTALVGTTALVVASPFIVPIAGHYHLRVVNSEPLSWHYGPLMWPALLGTVRANAVWFAGALAGTYWLHSRAVITWMGAASILVLTGLLQTPIVPPFHFWIYLLAVVALLCGVLIAKVLIKPAVVVAAVLVAVVWHWPAYAARQDFTLVRRLALDRNPNFGAMTLALRRLSLPDEVVLGTYGAANLIIGPAGRKVVAPQPAMANPYVPVEQRVADREAMLRAVQAHDRDTFTQLSDRYRVSLVMSVGRNECAAAESFDPLVPVQRSGDVCLARVRAARP